MPCLATQQFYTVLCPRSAIGNNYRVQVDRAALPAPRWLDKVVPPYLPPQNRLEMEVQLIWVAVMNKKEMISCDADFSAVGGNMMHAVISNGIVRWGSLPAVHSCLCNGLSSVSAHVDANLQAYACLAVHERNSRAGVETTNWCHRLWG